MKSKDILNIIFIIFKVSIQIFLIILRVTFEILIFPLKLLAIFSPQPKPKKKKKYDIFNLDDNEKEAVRSGMYEDINFEVDDLEEDDYYYDDEP